MPENEKGPDEQQLPEPTPEPIAAIIVSNPETQGNTLSEPHTTRIMSDYGFDPNLFPGCFQSCNAEEIKLVTGVPNTESCGIKIQYPGYPDNSRYRLDEPVKMSNGKTAKYLSPPGQANAACIPPGVNIANPNIIITEGEMKAFSATAHGIPAIALGGIWNWRRSAETDDFKLSDAESLIQDLDRDWSGQQITLLYDSDITPAHRGYPAFQRLAEQLYRRGADSVKITTLPGLRKEGKTGLDDYIIEKKRTGRDPVAALNELIAHVGQYLPTGDGAEAFARLYGQPKRSRLEKNNAVAAALSVGEIFTEEILRQAGFPANERGKARKDARRSLDQQIEDRKKAEKNRLPGPAYDIYAKGLAGSGFHIDADGNLFKEKASKFGPVSSLVSNTVARISRCIVRDDGAEQSMFFLIEGHRAPEMALCQIEVPVKTFAGMMWPLEKWGPQTIIFPGLLAKDLFKEAIQIQTTKIKPEVQNVYSHLGFRVIDGELVYLTPGGAIGANGIVNGITVNFEDAADALTQYTLQGAEGVTLEEAAKQSLLVLDVAKRDRTIPLFAFTMLSVLLDIFRRAHLSPGFSMVLVGRTGSLKSTLAALMLNFWGADFNTRNLTGSFEDTANSLGRLLFLAKDALFVIDDRYPSASKQENMAMESVQGKILRRSGNRSGRRRMRPNSTVRASDAPRGLALITSEIATSGASAMARGLQIEVDRSDFDMKILTAVQEKRTMLPIAMRGFIQHICREVDELPKKIQEVYPQIREAFQLPGAHPQIAEQLAQLYMAVNLYIEFITVNGALTEADAATLLKEVEEVLKRLGRQQAQAIHDENPALRFLNLMREMKNQNRIYFKGLDGAPPPDAERFGYDRAPDATAGQYQVRSGSDFIGYVDDDYYYLLPELTIRLVSTACSAQGDPFPVKSNTLYRLLERENVLHLVMDTTRGTADRTPKKTIGGVSQRFLTLKRAALDRD